MKKKINFDLIYKMFDGELSCLKIKCNKCEKTSCIFLPGEAEFLAKKLGIKPEDFSMKIKINNRKIYAIPENTPDCIFLKDSKCSIYPIRPLDCRSYPVIPKMKNGKLNFVLEESCPLVKSKKVSQKFINQAIEIWKTANLPTWWIKIFDKKFDVWMKGKYLL